MTEEQVKQMMESIWYLHEHFVPVIQDGYQTTYYECFISLSPSYDEAKRFRLANMQRWFGIPGYNGFVEQAVGRHLVEIHNEHIRRLQQTPLQTEQTAVEPKPEDPPKPKRKRPPRPEPTPEQLEHRRQVSIANLKKARAKNPKHQKAETASPGAVPQGQPLQAEANQTQNQVQPQEKASRKILINTTSNL